MTKQKIAIIGAGKLAYSIVSALIKSKYDIQIVISKKLSSARVLSEKFKIPHCSNSIKNISAEVNVFFLTVPDGEIKKVAEKLSKLKRDFSKSICIHFSGVENISVLNSLRKKGCAIGSIHIIRPFPSKNIVDIRNSPASIETENRQAKSFLLQMCKKLKLKPHSINSDEKVFHHLAAVHSSNFLVGNLFNAFFLITSENNFPKNILRKTTQSALDNVFNLSPVKALSGPIDRGDIYTIQKHISALEEKIKNSKRKDKARFHLKSYIFQSIGLLEVVEAKYGKLDKNHLKIKKLLERELK